MTRRQKARKLTLTIAVALGLLSGLLGFCAFRNTQQPPPTALSFLVALTCFALVFGAVIGIYRILVWVVLGFCPDRQITTPPYRINLKRGLNRTVFVLAALAAVCCAFFACSIPYGEYVIAQNDLKTFQNQTADYEGQAYYDYMQRVRLEDNYWLNLPKGHMVGLCVIFSLVGATIGFCAVWFGYKFIESRLPSLSGSQEVS